MKKIALFLVIYFLALNQIVKCVRVNHDRVRVLAVSTQDVPDTPSTPIADPNDKNVKDNVAPINNDQAILLELENVTNADQNTTTDPKTSTQDDQAILIDLQNSTTTPTQTTTDNSQKSTPSNQNPSSNSQSIAPVVKHDINTLPGCINIQAASVLGQPKNDLDLKEVNQIATEQIADLIFRNCIKPHIIKSDKRVSKNGIKQYNLQIAKNLQWIWNYNEIVKIADRKIKSDIDIQNLMDGNSQAKMSQGTNAAPINQNSTKVTSNNNTGQGYSGNLDPNTPLTFDQLMELNNVYNNNPISDQSTPPNNQKTQQNQNNSNMNNQKISVQSILEDPNSQTQISNPNNNFSNNQMNMQNNIPTNSNDNQTYGQNSDPNSQNFNQNPFNSDQQINQGLPMPPPYQNTNSQINNSKPNPNPTNQDNTRPQNNVGTNSTSNTNIIKNDEKKVDNLMSKINNLQDELQQRQVKSERIKKFNEVKEIFGKKNGLGDSLVSMIKTLTSDFLHKFCIAKISLDNETKFDNLTKNNMLKQMNFQDPTNNSPNNNYQQRQDYNFNQNTNNSNPISFAKTKQQNLNMNNNQNMNTSNNNVNKQITPQQMQKCQQDYQEIVYVRIFKDILTNQPQTSNTNQSQQTQSNNMFPSNNRKNLRSKRNINKKLNNAPSSNFNQPIQNNRNQLDQNDNNQKYRDSNNSDKKTKFIEETQTIDELGDAKIAYKGSKLQNMIKNS